MMDETQYFWFHQYPNPSSGFTSIRVELAESLPVQISLLNIIGQEEMELLNEFCQPGMQEVQLNTSQLRSGIYFIRIKTDRITTSKLIVQ